MKRYIAHIQNKEPHERRQHALKIAGVATGVLFVAWVATLGTRMPLQQQNNAELSAAAAEAAAANQAHLEVSQTSVYSLPSGQ